MKPEAAFPQRRAATRFSIAALFKKKPPVFTFAQTWETANEMILGTGDA